MSNAIFSFFGLCLICVAVIYLADQGDPQWKVGFYVMSFFAILSQVQIILMHKLVSIYKGEQTK